MKRFVKCFFELLTQNFSARRNSNGKNPDGQGFESGDFFAHFAKKYYSSLDGLDRRNGLGTKIVFRD